MVEDDVGVLARLVQQAALDPTLWEPALNSVSDFVGAAGATLLSANARQRFAPSSSDLAELMEAYFAGGWFKVDRRDVSIPLIKANGIVVDQDFQSVDNIECHDYYQDFLRRYKRKWFAGVGASTDGDLWCLALQRSPEHGPFTQADAFRLQYVRRLLVDAAALSRHVGQAWLMGLEQALNVMPQPALVFDSEAHILHLNEVAALQLGAFITKDRRVRFHDPRATAKFERLLKNALASLGRSVPKVIETVDIAGRRYACHALTLLDQARLVATDVSVLMLMKPVTRGLEATMRQAYKLTDAEIGISLALAAGKTVKEISSINNVKETTIRAQLKSIYSKADISKQSQLVALIRSVENGISL